MNLKKKLFFYKKLNDVQKAIWDMEFKVDKSRTIREGVRLDRDRIKEAVAQVEARLKAEISKEEREKLEKELKINTENVLRFERQMEMIDTEINGIKPTAESPGQAGILDTIQSLYELKKMYKEYVRVI